MPRAARSQTTTATGPRLVRRAPRTTTRPTPASHEAIAARAYELFERDGHSHGHDLDHWLEAERQLVQAPVARPARRSGGKKAKAN